MALNPSAAGNLSEVGNDSGMPTGGTSPQFVNPASMPAQALANLSGNPLGNAGANLGHYQAISEHLTPDENKTMATGFARGGLATFADGGMPDPNSGAAMGGGDPSAGTGGEQGGADPRLMQLVQQIFEQNIHDPQALAQQLLKLVETEIAKVVSPQERAFLKTPAGEHQMQQIIAQLMSQMQSGPLAQMMNGGAGADPNAAGAPPPPTQG